ncbi:MAG: TerB N-terminal domain-containing protein [Gemmatimonadales bacterium]
MWWFIVLVVLYLLVRAAKRSTPDEDPPNFTQPARSRSRVAAAPVKAVIDWLPRGATAVVVGQQVPGGLVYVGANAPAANGPAVEPSLIDPTLPVNWGAPNFQGVGMSYWPSYSQITPESRAAYLLWLSSTRDSPATYIGYVFLYFYGLERRALVDLQLAEEASELSDIANEAERLLATYGANSSFRGYAGRFLELLDAVLQRTPSSPADLPNRSDSPGEVPIGIRLAVGSYSARQAPVPAEWALALVRAHPGISLGTPAHRCATKWDALFLARYAARFGTGMVIREPKRRVSVTYQPASGGFSTGRRVTVQDVPDVTDLAKPVAQLSELAIECTDALDAFSRYLGRNPEGAGDLTAVGLLPPELLLQEGGERVNALTALTQARLGASPRSLLPLGQLVTAWGGNPTEKLTSKEFASLTGLLGNLRVGVEPDVRFGGSVPTVSSQVVIFSLNDQAPSAPSPEYSATALIVHLCGMVIGADGAVDDQERRHLVGHLETVLQLDEAERDRIEAKLTWLAAVKPTTTGLKRRIADLDVRARSMIGQLLLDIAASDGRITKEEIGMLERVFTVLDLDTQEVYRYIHSAGGDPGPVAIRDPRGQRHRNGACRPRHPQRAPSLWTLTRCAIVSLTPLWSLPSWLGSSGRTPRGRPCPSRPRPFLRTPGRAPPPPRSSSASIRGIQPLQGNSRIDQSGTVPMPRRSQPGWDLEFWIPLWIESTKRPWKPVENPSSKG